MNSDIEIENHLIDEGYIKGLNQMYQWVEIALIEAELPGTVKEKITSRIKSLRQEK